MQKTALMLMMITVLSKISGFLREVVFSYFYGTSYIKDAYVVAFSIPAILTGFIANGLMIGFIPIYNKVLDARGKNEADKFTSNLTSLIGIISTVLLVLVFVFTKEIVQTFASGFSGEVLKLSINFTRIMVLAIYALAISSIYKGYLNANKSFAIPAMTSIIMNIIIVGFIIMSVHKGYNWLAYGTTIGIIFQYIVFLPQLKKNNFHYTPILNLTDENIKTVIALAIPMIINSAVLDIGTIVDKSIASSLTVGGISSLEYASRIIGLVSGIVIMSVTTSIYPKLSKFGVKNEVVKIKNTIAESIRLMMLIIIPCVIGIMVLSESIIDFVFGRGQFGIESIKMTSSLLFYYAPLLIGQSLVEIFNRGFYSLKNIRTPVVISVISMFIDIFLNVALSKIIGLNGLALSTTIGRLVGLAFTIVAFRKGIGPMDFKTDFKMLIKIIVAGAIMGFCAYFLFHFLTIVSSGSIALFITIMGAVIVYALVVLLLRVEEAYEILNIIRKKFLGNIKNIE